MPEAKLGSIRRTQSLRRSVGDRDDRGWTLLHVGARRGDVREPIEQTPPPAATRGYQPLCGMPPGPRVPPAELQHEPLVAPLPPGPRGGGGVRSNLQWPSEMLRQGPVVIRRRQAPRLCTSRSSTPTPYPAGWKARCKWPELVEGSSNSFFAYGV
ncbi:hypothetical protein RHMOL_Rhmol01G0140100 [Rhododendron molle]|uniref:Uncharacterized protein n=1 Tax=Rhododendron molle TaxID=49168 RepID=A0ACC0Q365_RHOML|nr:hypothetical protein RHMOL_Rhmol01G0140100 [Rhododendron molle]